MCERIPESGAQIEEIGRVKLVERSARVGKLVMKLLQCEISKFKFQVSVRGLGLLIGVELREPDGSPAGDETLRLIKKMLRAGFILLPEGEYSNVISFTPPLTITEAQLKTAVSSLQKALATRE